MKMISKAEKDSLRAIIADTVTLLCKNGLSAKFNKHYSIEGLIGITLDDEELMLVSIKELVQNPNPPPEESGSTADDSANEETDRRPPSANKRRQRKRRHSRGSTVSDTFSLTPSVTPAKRSLFSPSQGTPGGNMDMFSQASGDTDSYNLTLQDIKQDESDDDLIEIIKEEPGLTLPGMQSHIVSIQAMPHTGANNMSHMMMPGFNQSPMGGMGGMLPMPGMPPPGPLPLETGNYDDLMSQVELLPGSGVFIKKSTYNQLQFIDKGSKLVRKLVREIFPDVQLLANSSCMGKGENSSGLDRHKVEVIKDTGDGYCEMDEKGDNDEVCAASTLTTVKLVDPDSVAECFKCPTCQQSFDSQRQFKAHSKLHNHKCDKCGSRFLRIIDLRKHEEVCLADENQFPLCEVCGESFDTANALNDHRQTVHMTETDAFKEARECPICKKQLYSPYYFQEHMQKHSDGPTCQCERCGASFKFSSSLRRHLKICLDVGQRPQNEFTCSECGAVLEDAMSWRDHWKESHDESKEIFSCTDDQCGKVFISKAGLRGHALSTHTNQDTSKGVVCEICNKIFPTKYHLREHEYTHSKEVRAHCDNCGRQFKHPRSLRNHLKCCPGSQTPMTKTFRCEACNKSFRTKSLLHQHMLGKHSEKTHAICSQCGKKFNWRTSYLNHVKTCTGIIKEGKGKVKDECGEEVGIEVQYLDVSTIMTFPEDIGEEVVVVPIPYEEEVVDQMGGYADMMGQIKTEDNFD